VSEAYRDLGGGLVPPEPPQWLRLRCPRCTLSVLVLADEPAPPNVFCSRKRCSLALLRPEASLPDLPPRVQEGAGVGDDP